MKGAKSRKLDSRVMLPNIKFNPVPKFWVRGNTLVELLVATAIIGTISVIGVNVLWDSIMARAKQNSIEGTSENFRVFLTTLTRSIHEAKSINIPDPTLIQITGNPCQTLRFNTTNKWLEEAVVADAVCTPPPPDAVFERLTQDKINLTKFELSPTGFLPSFVTIKIEGIYQDGLGEHLFRFYSTVTPRVTL